MREAAWATGIGASMPRVAQEAASTWVLVDEDVDGDRRVQRSIERAGMAHRVIDLRDESRLPARAIDMAAVALRLAAWAAAALCRMPTTMRRLRETLGASWPRAHRPGLRAVARWLRRTCRCAAALRFALRHGAPQAVHAHDLYAAVAMTLVRWPERTRLVYDSHEFQIHRNRRLGTLRVWIEHQLESRVLRGATEVRVVNLAVARLLRRCHPHARAPIAVEGNAHFPHHPPARVGAEATPVMVYVGKAVHGRRLEWLDRPARDTGFEVTAFLLGSDLPASIAATGWRLGPTDYEAPLRAMTRQRRCLMWCALEQRSLSYRLSTPNKFFQALALGIPVVASAGTYLAELVEQHGLGAVLEGDDLRALAAAAAGREYAEWVANVLSFRDRLARGELAV